MAQPDLTREGLALELLDRIIKAESFSAQPADRAYILDLLRDILAVIDGSPLPTRNDGQVISLNNVRAAQAADHDSIGPGK